MEKIKAFFKSDRFAEIFRFGIAGGLGFIVDYGILFTFTEFLKINYLISSGISFTVSVIVNYIICIIWVFKDAKKMTTKPLFYLLVRV